MIDAGLLHHWAPIVFGFLSYFSNILFIYIVARKTRSSFGAYKYILICFGVFDITYSTVDMLVAMGSHSEHNTFCVFVTNGPFAEDLEMGFLALCFRGMFFSLSYGLLELHFFYRYIALCRPQWISFFQEPKWIIVMFCGVIVQGLFWFCSCYFLLYPDNEMRSFMKIPFRRDYNANVYKVPMLGSTYWGASNNLIIRTSIGIIIVTIISCFTIAFCIYTGYTIYSKLRDVDISENTKKMHKNLLKALAIQTFVPFVISYLPCVVAWSVPIIHVDSKTLNNNTSIVAVAMFPFIDPIVIIFLIPDYRNAFIRIFLPRLQVNTRTNPESTDRTSKP